MLVVPAKPQLKCLLQALVCPGDAAQKSAQAKTGTNETPPSNPPVYHTAVRGVSGSVINRETHFSRTAVRLMVVVFFADEKKVQFLLSILGRFGRKISRCMW